MKVSELLRYKFAENRVKVTNFLFREQKISPIYNSETNCNKNMDVEMLHGCGEDRRKEYEDKL